MKAWAKSFYLSAAWEKTRAAYLMSQDYICERCGQPAKIVHHKRWLNRENINDISVTLCWDNLEALCQDCHNKEHHKQERRKRYTPNALQMQHIQENVCTHFGTNMDILQNKFDENTWNAYYEGKIEPFAIQLSLVMTNMSFTERERACGNAIFFSANRLQYASNATKLSVSTQLFDRALLNRNGVMDIWNMAHVEDGEKYYIRKEYTEVSELHKGSEQPVIIQQVPQQTEPAAGEEPQNGQEEKEGVNNAS